MEELKLIKDKYGEKMMHLCRKLFPTILENEGRLYKLLREHFEVSKDLYDDLIKYNKTEAFKDYIYSYVDFDRYRGSFNGDPFYLMKKKGYTLYQCKTQEDIDYFKKYYDPKEELCTFSDPNRLKSTNVFFAVKDGAEKLKREDFKNPDRCDDYSKSVISIQFDKGTTNTLSIISRYNTTVRNPNATFGNNLEFIAPGLTRSFEEYFGYNIDSYNGSLDIPGYVKTNEGKHYKYNYKINNVYYCPNNVIIYKNKVTRLDREKYILLDYFIIDLVNKRVGVYDDRIDDSFLDGLQSIKKIEVVKDRSTRRKIVRINDDILIELDKYNRILSYDNPHVKEIDENFYLYNIDSVIEKLVLPNVEHIPDDFMFSNKTLKQVYLDNVKSIGNGFMHRNDSLEKIYIPSVTDIGDYFLAFNKSLREFSAPNVKNIGDYFMLYNMGLFSLDIPKAEVIGSCFLQFNLELLSLYLPKAKSIKSGVLKNNEKIYKFYTPIVEHIGNGFLGSSLEIQEAFMPRLISVSDGLLSKAFKMKRVIMPKTTNVGKYFMNSASNIEYLDMRSLNKTDEGFLNNLDTCDNVSLDSLESDEHLPDVLKEKISNNSKTDNVLKLIKEN